MWGKFPMLNFSRRASTLGWFFPPDSQKVLKIAHFCVSSHIGGSGGSENIWTPKYSGSWPIVAKIADLGPPGAPQ